MVDANPQRLVIGIQLEVFVSQRHVHLLQAGQVELANLSLVAVAQLAVFSSSIAAQESDSRKCLTEVLLRRDFTAAILPSDANPRAFIDLPVPQT